MTFCIGILLKDGLVAIADTRITTGSECTSARKMYVNNKEKHSLFMMTSGLRSLRDKAITYFEEALGEDDKYYDKMFKAVNVLSQQLRLVAQEDKEVLEESGLNFNIHCLVGGQLEKDETHKLFLVYPQGNWVEITEGTPYHIIGASGYGKPVLDRTLKYTDSIKHALKVAILAFDSTRISSNEVDYPIDLAIYPTNSFEMNEFRLCKEDLSEIAEWWQERLRSSVDEIPASKIEEVLSKIKNASICK
jgi:putative proteasome-type protease